MPISTSADIQKAKSAYDFIVLDADGNEYDLAQRRGFPTLFFNSASSCGFSKFSFENANKLCKKYGADYGFTCIAFPSSSFFQEPNESAEAKKIGCSTYEAQFPIMGKVSVNGDDASPLWKYMQKEKPGFLFTQFIKWNYTAFLCDCDGKVVDRFSPGIGFDSVDESLKKKVLVNMKPISASTSTATAITTTSTSTATATTTTSTTAPTAVTVNEESNVKKQEDSSKQEPSDEVKQAKDEDVNSKSDPEQDQVETENNKEVIEETSEKCQDQNQQ